jgi:hypothetical protein
MSGILCAAAAAAGVSMGLTLIDAQLVSNSGTGTTVVVNKPTGTVSGDLLVAVMISDAGPAWTQPAGFTEVLDVVSAPFGGASWKAAGGAEPSTYTFTADAPHVLVAALLCFRNAAFDTIGAPGANTVAPPAGSITLSGEGLTLAVFAANNDGVTFSTPTGCTPVIADSDTAKPSIALFRKAVAAGATPIISSVSSPSRVSRGLQIGIKKV